MPGAQALPCHALNVHPSSQHLGFEVLRTGDFGPMGRSELANSQPGLSMILPSPTTDEGTTDHDYRR